jgi:Undecaprenyl-phosphate glucose phosphotransferase
MIIKKDNIQQIVCALDILGLITSFIGSYLFYSKKMSVFLIDVVFVLCVVCLWIMINLNVKSCQVNAQTWIRKVLYDLVVAYSLLTSGVIFIVAVFGEFKPNSHIILVALLSSVFFSTLIRVFYIKICRTVGVNDSFKRRIIIVGADHVAERVFNTIAYSKLGYMIEGVVANFDEQSKPDIFPNSHYLGPIGQLSEILSARDIHEVIVALPLRKEKQIASVTDICEYEGVRCKIVPDYYRIIKSKLVFEEIGDIPLIAVRHEPLGSFSNRLVKRAFDVVFSAMALIFLSPVFLVISLLIKFTSPGDIFFRQKRVGVDNKEFTMYKFRTMVTQTEKKSDTVWTTKNDSRVTSIGTFLRKTNLDELPQFWNVLIGNMTVAGPRPEREFFVNQFKDEIPSYKVRHMVKSGVTGWAQVNGWRGDTSIKKRVECDLYYIENWSLWLDIKIIWMTLFSKKTNENAY